MLYLYLSEYSAELVYYRTNDLKKDVALSVHRCNVIVIFGLRQNTH
jgi:hypothetical protein